MKTAFFSSWTEIVFFLSGTSSIQMDEPPLVMAAASIMQELCYQHREELSAGFITAGWDRKKGPQVGLLPFCYYYIEVFYTGSKFLFINAAGSTYTLLSMLYFQKSKKGFRLKAHLHQEW